jgi:hypothetical protein
MIYSSPAREAPGGVVEYSHTDYGNTGFLSEILRQDPTPAESASGI